METPLSIDEFAADMVLDEFLDAADGSYVLVDSLTDAIAASEPGSASRRLCIFAAFDELLPTGRCVILTGLNASPQLNGCRAVVIGPRDGERFPLRVTSPGGGAEQKLRAKVWNLRPLGGMPGQAAAAKPPSRFEIKSASVPELRVIGHNFAQRDGRVALHFLEAVQEQANEDDDPRSPWSGHMLGRAGIAALVVNTMQAHLHLTPEQGAALQKMGCLALWMMTCGESEPASNDSDASNERRQHAADAGALPLLVALMRAHEAEHPEVCQAACMAFYNILGGGNCHDACPGGEGIRAAAADACAIEAILSFLNRHAQKPNAGALRDGSKCYAEVGLKAIGNICHLARRRDGTVCRADSLAAIQRCSRANDQLLATVARLAKAHATTNPTVLWVSNNVMKICMQALASASLFDVQKDPENLKALQAAGLRAEKGEVAAGLRAEKGEVAAGLRAEKGEVTKAKDPYGKRATSLLDGSDPACVVCKRTARVERMSFCGHCQGFACDDGHGQNCGSYWAPQRHEYDACGVEADEADRFYREDRADYEAACSARGEFPDEDIGLFTCGPCWKKWREE
jgi:hypothetical protein